VSYKAATTDDFDRAREVVFAALRELPREAFSQGFMLPRGGLKMFVRQALAAAGLHGISPSLITGMLTAGRRPDVEARRRAGGLVCMINDNRHPGEASIALAMTRMWQAIASADGRLPNWIISDQVAAMVQHGRFSEWIERLADYFVLVAIPMADDRDRQIIDELAARLRRDALSD